MAKADSQRDNWRMKVDVQGMDYTPPEKEHLFPGWTGVEGQFRDYFPPSAAELAAMDPTQVEVNITRGQERFGLTYKEGDPIPKKEDDPLWKTKATITTGG
jgi:hypothetical protein